MKGKTVPKSTQLCLSGGENQPPDHDSARQYAQSTLSGALFSPEERNLAAAYLAVTSKAVAIPEVTREEFHAWYREYPRKKAPDAAFKAYRSARKAASAGQLLTALRGYRWSSDDPKFLPYPATWLNAGAWRENREDEPVKKSQADIWSQAARDVLDPMPDVWGGSTIDGEVSHV